MRWQRAVTRTASELAAIPRILFGSRPGFRVLLYHSVGSRLECDSYGISIAPDLFERHVQALVDHRSTMLVDLSQRTFDGEGLKVAVTFDDGYKDTLYLAAPVLLKHKIPFTVFAVPSFIRRQAREYLTLAELRKLADLPGVCIGSHGATHRPLADCDEATLWEELYGSRCWLEDVVGKPVTAVAYPHGSVSPRVVAAARRAGYTRGACSRFDINGPACDPLLLCRTEIVASDSVRVFGQKLVGAWDWCRWRGPSA